MSGQQNAAAAFSPVSPDPVMASELTHFTSTQAMAHSQVAKVIAALSNIAVFGIKESARVAAAKVILETASGKFEAVSHKDKPALAGQNIPDAWADRLRMFPPPNATRPNGQTYQAAA